MSTLIPEKQPADAKPIKKTKWYWHGLNAVALLWMLGGVNVLLLQDIPLLLFLLGVGFALMYPMEKWLKPKKPLPPPLSLKRLTVGLSGIAWAWFVLALTFATVVFVIPPFSISPETTYLTEPRSKEYYGIDYPAVVEKELDPKVPAEDNGFRLLTEMLGRPFYGEKLKDEHWNRICQYLDLPTDIEPKLTFVEWYDYTQTLTEEEQKIVNTSSCNERLLPWSEEAIPFVRQWLDENDAAVELFIAAVQKPVLYVPPMFEGILLDAKAIYDQQCREMVRSLQVRVRYRLAIGEVDKAWDDVLAMYRFGEQHRRFIWQLTTSHVSAGIVGAANQSAETVLLHSGWTAEEILRRADEIAHFQRPLNEDEILSVLRYERLIALDSITQVANGTYDFGTSSSCCDKPTSDVDSSERFRMSVFMRFLRLGIAMTTINKHYDRLEQWCFNDEPLSDSWSMTKLGDYAAFKMMAWYGMSGSAPVMIGEMIAVWNDSSVEAWRTSQTRFQAEISLLRLMFALEAYKRDNGNYPDELNDLRGDYIAEIPLDPFSGKSFRYILNEDAPGFLLYSVGPNGIDEDGRGYNDVPKGDDIRRKR
jgi:hypothetical protein